MGQVEAEILNLFLTDLGLSPGELVTGFPWEGKELLSPFHAALPGPPSRHQSIHVLKQDTAILIPWEGF